MGLAVTTIYIHRQFSDVFLTVCLAEGYLGITFESLILIPGKDKEAEDDEESDVSGLG
jgi:hypothetical protein